MTSKKQPDPRPPDPCPPASRPPDPRSPGPRPPDPRVIFALVLVLSGYGVAIRDVRLMAALLLMALICAAALSVSFKRLFGSLRRLWQAAIIIAVLQSVFAPSGTVLLAPGGFPLLTAGGLLKGLLILFRLALFITGGALFTVYPQRALIQAMVQLRLPYDAAYMVSIGLRFIPQMGEEFRDSLTALQLRGVIISELKLKKRLSLYSYLLLPAIAASLQNARELAMSMEMRAFRAMRERTSYYSLSLNRRDVAMLLLVLLLAALLALIAVLLYKGNPVIKWVELQSIVFCTLLRCN